MDLMQLEMFVATVEEGNFRKAALRVFRTQPAVSMALRKLEEDVGVSLFDRSTRNGYSLTDAGDLLYKYARQILGLRQEATRALTNLSALESGRIRIGFSETSAECFLPGLISEFRKQLPGLKIEVVTQSSESLIRGLKSRTLDLALLPFNPPDEEFDVRQVASDCLVLITNVSHPGTREARISIKNLIDETLLLYTIDDESRRQTLNTLSRHGIQPHVEVTGGTIRSVKAAVAGNLGVALVPSLCVTDELERGEFLSARVEGLDIEWKVWEAHRRSDDRTYIRGAMTVLSTMSCGVDFCKTEANLPPRESPGRIPYVMGR